MNARNLPAVVTLTLDGQVVHAAPQDTLLDVARREGIALPHLCHADGLRPAGNCRACVVEIDGERALAPSCCRGVAQDMTVRTDTPRAREARLTVLELLLADAGVSDTAPDSELQHWAARTGARADAFAARAPCEPDRSHPAFVFDASACIQCGRCVRACREEQVNDVLGMALRGAASRIVFDQDDAVAASSCVACGECVQACPTSALLPVAPALPVARQVRSVCPWCGVGCQLSYAVGVTPEGSEHVLGARGENGPANHGRLCVKGRFGFDYVHSPRRLTRPRRRRPGRPKDAADIERLRDGHLALDDLFEPVSWDTALDAAAGGLARIRDTLGPDAVAGFGSAKGSNEEAWLFQHTLRTAIGTNNVDHCTRLCHASSVTALLEGVGSGAVSNPVADVAQAELVLVIGANPVVNHPVAATFLKNAVKRGTRLVLADPRRSELARHAAWHLPFRPGTDVALLNALLHVIFDEGLADEAFLAARVDGTEALRAGVKECTPERMSEICGIAPDTLREVARAYATAHTAMILWGMGISQHVHGTDNARCLIALAMACGQVGRPGTGLHPLRGQNNVQGASDAGLIPMMLPGYVRVDDTPGRHAFERAWGRESLPAAPGLTVVEVMHAAREGRLQALWVQGENPAMSDPDLAHARAALATLPFLVVQDIFATETAALADVLLPASAQLEKWGSYTNTDRLVQVGRPVLAPPGEARQDLWIIDRMARRLGGEGCWIEADGDGHRAAEAPVARVWERLRATVPAFAGLSWERLLRDGAAVYPTAREDDPGQPVMFQERFPTATGRARLVPVTFAPGPESRDADFPLVLTTGRVLEHWHTGSMTRRARVLETLAPMPAVALHPVDAARLGISEGDAISVESRHGSVRSHAALQESVQPGQVFLPFAYVEAAANLLTGDALDAAAKIPGFKVTAVRVTRVNGLG